MVVTDNGKVYSALLIGGSRTVIPGYMSIGSGSGAAVSSVGSLFAEFADTRTAVLTTDNTTPGFVTWNTDWGASVMSGLGLREFGLESGSGTVEQWNYENLGDEVEFTGSNELRVELTWNVF